MALILIPLSWCLLKWIHLHKSFSFSAKQCKRRKRYTNTDIYKWCQGMSANTYNQNICAWLTICFSFQQLQIVYWNNVESYYLLSAHILLCYRMTAQEYMCSVLCALWWISMKYELAAGQTTTLAQAVLLANECKTSMKD